jgi:hypothetical protein
MHEYVNVSASSYDPAALAAKLTEKSAEGWELVAIVPTGGDTTAFLRRAVNQSAPADAAVVGATMAPAASPTPDPVDEPAGWAVAPEPTAATAEPTPAASPAASATVIAAATPAAAQSQPATPAGWYHDPSGRFELRYWDGSQWTEHVARGGQQYTDPPVA